MIQKIKDMKLKWLQIRIVHWILATKVVLMKKGIVNCSKCTFCEDDKDGIDHIFWQCSCIKRFWQILESTLNTKCNMTFQARITQNFVLFGLELDADNSVKTDEVFGFIILFVKHYIFINAKETCPYHVWIYFRNSFSWDTKSKNIMPRSSPETIFFL